MIIQYIQSDVINENVSSVQVVIDNLKACSRTRNLQRGKQVHADAVEWGYGCNLYVASSLINMYAKCGCIVHAREIFDAIRSPDVVSWTVLIMGYAENGKGLEALDLFVRMIKSAREPNSVTFMAALKACISLGLQSMPRGKHIHTLALAAGCVDIYVQNTLVDMFAKCHSMKDARQVFDRMKHPTVASWNVLIMGYAENGQDHNALEQFKAMLLAQRCDPDSITFVAALKACICFALKGNFAECFLEGKQIHKLAVESGFGSDLFVQNTLIDMYAKCGKLEDAHKVFDTMNRRDIISWTVLIMGYAENDQPLLALEMFSRMRAVGPPPNSVTVMAALKACTCLALKGETFECIRRAKEIHHIAVENGSDSDTKVQSSLLYMYVKGNSILEARQVFDRMNHPDVVSWTMMILGYADNGQTLMAFELFMRMRNEGPPPDSVTFAAALKVCALLGALDFGRKLHSEIISAKAMNIVVITCLVDLYAKCGSLIEAQSVFDLHPEARDLSTWTALLTGYSNCGDEGSVFRLFEGMQDAGLKPDGVTFLSVLACCSHAGLVEKGKECFQAMSTKHGIVPTVGHYTCMLDMLGRANRLHDAMALLARMPYAPNTVTWMTIFDVCRKSKNVEIGTLAFQSLVLLNFNEACAYVIMGNIYESRGMLRERDVVWEMRRKLEAWKTGGESCWTTELGEVHSFLEHPWG